jgi:hypothetical protein
MTQLPAPVKLTTPNESIEQTPLEDESIDRATSRPEVADSEAAYVVAPAMHEPAPALDVRGLVVHRSEIEDQATFMGAALLVPEEAALSIVTTGVVFTEAASYYGVSLELLRWRINSTGASLRVARSRQLRAQPRPFSRPLDGRQEATPPRPRTRAAD